MGQLVLLVVAAAWAAVLIPPLLRSRIENRPNSSVSDFRNQLSSLQRAMPARGVAMRSMARPLAPSPLSRPAATGRPPLRSGVRTHGGTQTRNSAQQQPSRGARSEGARLYDATPRARRHSDRLVAEARSARRPAARPAHVTARGTLKRRRANVLFVLALIATCSLFLAATTKTQAMLWVFAVAFVALCGYVYVLGQLRQREQVVVEPLVVAAVPRPRRLEDLRPAAPHGILREARPRRQAPALRQTPVRRPSADRWSHAV